MGAGISKLSHSFTVSPFQGPNGDLPKQPDPLARRTSCPSPAPAARMPALPAEVWGEVFGHLILPPVGTGSIGDLKAVGLASKTLRAEMIYAHQELIDRAASGAARAFLATTRSRLTRQEVALFGQARALDLNHTKGLSSARLGLIFAQTPQLLLLKLAHNQMGGAEAGKLPLAQLLQLQTLDLAYNEIGDAGARALPITHLKELQTLNLGYNRIRSAGARDLPIAQLARLQTLNLECNQIGSVGAQDLSIASLQQLRTLNLSYNCIGVAGGRALPVGQLPLLLTLHLGGNPIDEETKKILRQSTQATIL